MCSIGVWQKPPGTTGYLWKALEDNTVMRFMKQDDRKRIEGQEILEEVEPDTTYIDRSRY